MLSLITKHYADIYCLKQSLFITFFILYRLVASKISLWPPRLSLCMPSGHSRCPSSHLPTLRRRRKEVWSPGAPMRHCLRSLAPARPSPPWRWPRPDSRSRAPGRSSYQRFWERTYSAMAFPTSEVERFPPRSGVVLPVSRLFLTASWSILPSA